MGILGFLDDLLGTLLDFLGLFKGAFLDGGGKE
jgi:hypothetical protein